MKRKEFLKSIGAGAALAITFSCLGGCSSESLVEIDAPISDPETGLLFTIDLETAEASSLKNNGGYMIKNQIVVAKDVSGEYVAATIVCSHEQKKKIIFKDGEYYCTSHGARFDVTGKGLNKDASKGLKIYETSLEGNILSIIA
jgi:nitrite reductase/ring-hydroxylating ferredoxin subunit